MNKNIQQLALGSIFALACTLNLNAQVVSQKVGTNPTIITPSTAFEVESTNKGVLLPRVALTSATDATTILAPTTSMLVYNTATAGTSPNNVSPGYYYWTGTAWTRINNGTTSTDWTLTGNTGTTAGTNFIGTTDAIDFVTKTNNAERMRVTSAGNVGIGTTTPSNALHVSAATNPLKLSGLQAGSLTTDNILTADATGVVRQVAYNAVADQSLGSISAFAFSAVPADYLECNGAAVSRTTYAALFAKIGTTFGAGDGSTTFNVPDLRGEFIRGWDHGRGVDAGRVFGSNQLATNVWATGSNLGVPLLTGNQLVTWNGFSVIGEAVNINSDAIYETIDVGGSGVYSSTASYTNTSSNFVTYQTRPRNVAMVYAIKAKESVLVPTATSTAVTTAAIANEPWFNVATGTQATANTQSIYQMGQVLVNTATVPTGGTNAKLIVNSATNGAVQIKDGTEGAGKVFTSDANGVGTWKSPNVPTYRVTLPSVVSLTGQPNNYATMTLTLPAGTYFVYGQVYLTGSHATNSYFSYFLGGGFNGANATQGNGGSIYIKNTSLLTLTSTTTLEYIVSTQNLFSFTNEGIDNALYNSYFFAYRVND